MARPKKQHLVKRPDGRYRCFYHGHEFYGYSEPEALQKREDYKAQEAAGEFKRLNPTVADYAATWLPLHKHNVSPKCYADYDKQLSALTDAIGDKYMRFVTVDDAATVWAHFASYSASTIKRARMLYVALFDSAIENEICVKNPFRGKYAQPPKAQSGTHRVLTDEEINLIRTVPHRMQLSALIMLYCGLRRGEVFALTAQDIDLKACTISVTKAVRFVGNQPAIVAPKTASGVRSVPIPPIILPEIKNAVRSHLNAKESPLCGTATGAIMTDTALRRGWDSYMLHLSKAAGHPISIRAHDLRHTYCTMLRDAGIDMHQAMIWLGHSDEKMILHIYDHVTENRTKQSINLLKNALKRSNVRSKPKTKSK